MLDIRLITVGDALDQAAQKWGDTEGWVFEDARFTFNQIRAGANRVAKALMGLGLGQGDVIATWMSNRPEWLLLQMACAKTGIILTGLNTRFKTEETRYVLERGNVFALFYMPRFLNIDFLSILRDAIPGIENHVRGKARSPRVPNLRYLIEFDSPVSDSAISFAEFLSGGDAVSDASLVEAQRRQVPQDPVLMKFTSGTTAFPKGVLVHHLEALYWSAGLYSCMGVEAGEPVLNTQPFYHAGGSCGSLTAPLTLGCKVVTADYYEPERVLRLIEREKCVARTGSAAMYLMEIEHAKFSSFDLSSLRAAWCVGPPAVFERIRAAMGIEDMVQAFGATEAGGTCSRVGETWKARTTTCGRPLPGTEIRIVDPVTHQPLPVLGRGEIAFRGWWHMIGYFNQPEETAKVSDSDGWIRTGDLGFLDEEGSLHFVGRLKDTIRSGGENVAAQEIEAFLLTNPAIRQVAVIGVPDDRLGEVVMAVIEVKAAHRLSEADVIEFCTGAIANYKIPKYVRFTNEWPMTGSGKIQKFALRERLVPNNA
jgi:fatty-acyl-CoA synthase/long-chain acyl-CoA synthetase